MSDQASVGEHLRHALLEAPAFAEPFPHRIVTPVFGEATFNALRESFPDPARMSTKLTDQRDRRYSDRRLTVPLDRYVDWAPASARDVWRSVADVLYAESFGRLLFELFQEEFLPVLAENYGTRSFRYELTSEVVFDRTGFELLPHTDAAAKAVTLLTYFASEDDPEILGTRLFRPEDADFQDKKGASMFPVDRFRLAKQVPYRANLCVAFPRSSRSFHGVLPAETDRPRRLIQTSLIVVERLAPRPTGGR